MVSSNEKLCIQKRLLDFMKTDWALWLIIFPIQMFFSFCVSYFLTSPYYPYVIPTDLSNRVLSSLIDVFIALFGFVGLILVFTFRNLLTTKGDLQKEKSETSLKISQFYFQSMETKLHGVGHDVVAKTLTEAIKKCNKRIEEIDNDLARNQKQIDKASFLGVMSLGIALICILMNIWAFGAVTNEGLHFLNIAILLSLLFLWLDFILKLIRTVIK